MTYEVSPNKINLRHFVRDLPRSDYNSHTRSDGSVQFYVYDPFVIPGEGKPFSLRKQSYNDFYELRVHHPIPRSVRLAAAVSKTSANVFKVVVLTKTETVIQSCSGYDEVNTLLEKHFAALTAPSPDP